VTRGHHRQVVVGGWLTVVAGLFLMAAPFLFGYRVVGQAVANDLLAGAALAAAGAVGLRRAPRVPIAAVQALVGVWLLVAPTVLGYGGGPFVRSAFAALLPTPLDGAPLPSRPTGSGGTVGSGR
jgi:glucose dehydrogenase